MREIVVKIADCSYQRLVRIARACGFVIFQGGNHYKVKTVDGRLIAPILRHNRLKSHTAKAIVKRFNEFGANVVMR